MEIKTKIYTKALGGGICVGIITIIRDKIATIEPCENPKYLQGHEHLKNSRFKAVYLNKYDDLAPSFTVELNFGNRDKYYLCLEESDKRKLKLMSIAGWSERGSNLVILLTLILTALTFIVACLNLLKTK